MTLPELRNAPYPGDALDLDLCALFATERGARVLTAWRERGAPMQFLTSEICAAIHRVRKHCGTGELVPCSK